MRRLMNMGESETVETGDRWKRRVLSAAVLITKYCLLLSGYQGALNGSRMTIAQGLKPSWTPRMMSDLPRLNHSGVI